MSPETLTRKGTTATEPATSNQLPETLESSDSKLVYLYLATVDEATISDLQSTLGVKQLALFPTLDTLEGEGLIERDGETFTAVS